MRRPATEAHIARAGATRQLRRRLPRCVIGRISRIADAVEHASCVLSIQANRFVRYRLREGGNTPQLFAALPYPHPIPHQRHDHPGILRQRPLAIQREIRQHVTAGRPTRLKVRPALHYARAPASALATPLASMDLPAPAAPQMVTTNGFPGIQLPEGIFMRPFHGECTTESSGQKGNHDGQ